MTHYSDFNEAVEKFSKVAALNQCVVYIMRTKHGKYRYSWFKENKHVATVGYNGVIA